MQMHRPYQPVEVDPSWIVGKYALMNVQVERRNGRTEIEPRSWRIPFQWQGYHYQDHDDEPFLLLVNSSGGFVEGDVSHLRAHLEPSSRALFTTTASSKFYKCLNGELSREIVDIYVGPRATFEYFPDEAIPFARSRTQRITHISIEEDSRLFATDMVSAGRVHYGDGECFAFDSLFSEFEVRLGDRPVFLDRMVVTSEERVAALPRLWHGAKHSATVVSYAPDLPPHLESEVVRRCSETGGVEVGVSRIGRLLVTRILAEETWQAHEAIYRVWQSLRPSIAGKAARPIRKC